MSKKQRSAAERVYKEIRDSITMSSLKPGERLLEKKLSEKYKVSRSPLREALRRLQAQGYITVEKHRGAVVKRMSFEEVEELYGILALLESYSAAKAATLRTNKDIFRLKKSFDAMNSGRIKDDYRLWVRDNDNFHNLIHKASHSEVLLETITTLRNRLYRFRIMVLSKGIVEHFPPQHKEILDAIISGDAEKAEETMKNHMLDGKEERMELLRHYPELL